MSAISVHNLTYDVPGKRILDDISLKVEPGQIVSVMGQSGSGKTTLLKMLCGLLRPTSGEIWLEGVQTTELTEAGRDRIQMKTGMVFQYAALFDSLTVYDNIVFGVVRHRRGVKKRELDELVRRLLNEVGLEGIEGRYPSQLSGGQQKRVGLARALATEPSVVFYDEPTSGLDPITVNTIDELIMETRRLYNVTSVVVSHHLPSIFRISDRVAMLHEGRLVVADTPEAVRNSDNPVVQGFLHPEQAGAKAGAENPRNAGDAPARPDDRPIRTP